MKTLLLITLLIALSACTLHPITAIENGTNVLVPTKHDFQIKTGGKFQVGVDEYLVIGKMNLDDNIYSIIQLPFDISGIIL